MDRALLQSLVAGSGSGGQLVGGWIVFTLYAVIGLLAAAGSILMFRQVFLGRWEQLFWAGFLVAIAGFYLSFAAYFEASKEAWETELVVVGLFLAGALGGLFSRAVVASGYLMHGLWDLTHSLAGTSFVERSLTEIPLGYGVFCSSYDLVIAGYLLIGRRGWNEPGRLNLDLWRRRV